MEQFARTYPVTSQKVNLLSKFFIEDLFQVGFKEFYIIMISKTMKNGPKKIQNIASLDTQSTLSDISDSRFKINISLPKKITKQTFPPSILQKPLEQSAIRMHSQSLMDIPQITTRQTDIQFFDDESYKRLLDCANIQPITMKRMSRSSCNELQDINFSLVEIVMPIAQQSATQVACKQLQSNKCYNEDLNQEISQISQNRSQKMSHQMESKLQIQAKLQKQENRQESHYFNLFKDIVIQRNQKDMNNQINSNEGKAIEFKVIPPINKKKYQKIQNQESLLHQREINLEKASNNIKLKDYLYQSQIASKIKLLKRRQAKEAKKCQKRQLGSSFLNQVVLNPIKKVGEKERKYSVKSSEILQVVKNEILNDFKICSSTMKKLSEEMTEIEKWLQVPKDEDLWRIFELKRSISEDVTKKLCQVLEELRNRRIGLQKKQRK